MEERKNQATITSLHATLSCWLWYYPNQRKTPHTPITRETTNKGIIGSVHASAPSLNHAGVPQLSCQRQPGDPIQVSAPKTVRWYVHPRRRTTCCLWKKLATGTRNCGKH